MEVDLGGVLGRATLLVDGEPLPEDRGPRLVRDDEGRERRIELQRGNLLDPLPKVLIDGEFHRLAPPLEWYEWVWIALPALFAWRDGLLTLAVALPAVWINARVFRSGLPTARKYLVSGGVMVGAVVAYLVLGAIVIALLVATNTQWGT